MKYSNKIIANKNKNKRIFFVIAILVVLTTSGFFGYKYYSSKISKKFDGINYTPPTQEEKKAGDEKKREIVKKQEQEDSQKKDTSEEPSSQQPASSSNATVVITDAEQYDGVIEVRAFVSDKYQDGTCKITLTKGILNVSKTTEAYKDATTTICTNPLFNRSEFRESGDWQVVVEYSSQNYSGESNSQTVKIK